MMKSKIYKYLSALLDLIYPPGPDSPWLSFRAVILGVIVLVALAIIIGLTFAY